MEFSTECGCQTSRTRTGHLLLDKACCPEHAHAFRRIRDDEFSRRNQQLLRREARQKRREHRRNIRDRSTCELEAEFERLQTLGESRPRARADDVLLSLADRAFMRRPEHELHLASGEWSAYGIRSKHDLDLLEGFLERAGKAIAGLHSKREIEIAIELGRRIERRAARAALREFERTAAVARISADLLIVSASARRAQVAALRELRVLRAGWRSSAPPPPTASNSFSRARSRACGAGLKAVEHAAAIGDAA